MANEQQSFDLLVSQLMSGENEIRNDAEAKYSSIPDGNKMQLLLQSLLGSPNLEIKTMSAVLLRRLLSNIDDFTGVVPAEVQELCKAQLILGVQQEQDQGLRKKIAYAIAELAKCYMDDDGNNTWPEILKFLFDCCNAQAHEMREVALLILCSFPGIFANQQDTYLQVIKEMLGHCMQPSNPEQVRHLSARATCTFLSEAVEEGKYKMFVNLVPGILQAIGESVKEDGDDAVLKSFVELAETAPKLLKPHVQDTIMLMLQIVANSQIDNSWRHLALECIVTLAENAPAVVRKYGTDLIPKIVPEMLALMVDIEEDPDWSNEDEYDDAEADSNPVAGESSLDRFACGVGGKTVLPHVIATIPPMLQHADWRYRHAALMAISAVAEGCQKQMEPLLPNIVETILPFLGDSHPRVRYAACNALGQLSTDFQLTFQKKFHQKVLPSLMGVLSSDTAHPRVQAHAAAALVNFCEDCPQTVLSPYLDTLAEKLEMVLTGKLQELLQRGTKLVLEQVLTTIATVADTAEDKFVMYYDRFMPSLKYIFQNATDKDYRLLRGKCIECISLIGLAVGREKFLADASDVMQLLLKTQTQMEELEADDPQISYLIAAWARMCKIIGKEFVQYLPVVMPHVLKAAQIKPEVALLDVDDPQNADIDENEDWEFVNLGEQQKFGIKTSGLEDKSTACKMLVHYARELKEGFVDYAEQVVKTMVPLLKFYFHDEVRIAAAESLPHLLECAKIKGDTYLQQMWTYISPELLKAVEHEPEEMVVPEMMDSFAKCVETLGIGYISSELLTHLAQIIHEKLGKHLERQKERHDKRKDADEYDEEVEENLQDEHKTDEYILSKVSDIMHALFKTHRETMLPFFEQLLPDIHGLLHPERSSSDKQWAICTFDDSIELTGPHPERPSSDKQWAICIFDDLIEFTGPASIKYKDYFLNLMLNYIVDKSPEVRQAAAYGTGVMAQFGGKDYSAACAEAIPRLVQVISQPDAREKENINPTENCISAVTKICKYNAFNINLNEVIPTWLTWLPITEDLEEAPHVYGYLCDLVQANHPAVLGANHENLPKIVAILAEAIAAEVFVEGDGPKVAERVVILIRQVQTNAAVWNACLGQLDEKRKVALAAFVTAPNGV